MAATYLPYPHWLNPGDNAWQLTAATFVGLMSVPGLVVLYGGVMQKRWSVNSMMLAFTAFALVLVAWVLWAFDMGFGNPVHGISNGSGGGLHHLLGSFIGQSGFVAAAVIGPRLARDREIDAPNNLLMVAAGAGLLWLGWNGFNGGDPYYAGADAAAAVLNTNLATAVAFMVWVIWDYATGRKPSLIGSVNGMIVRLLAITPAAGL